MPAALLALPARCRRAAQPTALPKKLGVAMLRDADRMEVLRQPARCRARHHLRRGERRHGLRPRAREGRPLGGPAVAQHPRCAPRAGRGDRRASTGPSFGRNYYCRHDYEEVDATAADGSHRRTARADCRACPAERFGTLDGRRADDFAYTTRSTARSQHQGIRILFTGGARIVYRLSGTGTAGATLRVYIERFEPDTTRQGRDTQEVLADLIAVSRDIARITEFTGRTEPSVIT